MIINAFPTPIFSFALGNGSAKILQDVKMYLLEEVKNRKEGEHQFSLGGIFKKSLEDTGWHSPTNLCELDHEWSEELRKMLVNLCQSYLKQIKCSLRLGEDSKVACWGMMIKKGDMSFPHSHPGCKMSGTIWIDAPADMKGGKLCFMDPRGGARGDPSMQKNHMEFDPKPNTGVVFPNWLEHYVTPHDSNDTRISIAWNIK